MPIVPTQRLVVLAFVATGVAVPSIAARNAAWFCDTEN
jgi:hypothetical protein